MVSACGGGGNSSSPSAPPAPPPASGPTWTAGVFEPSSAFENRCESVRIGADIEGNPFPDRPGSTVEENFWLRSWTNETYLWNDEVVDRNPAAFEDRLEYFALLRTTATTPSGKDKDDFHFSQPTEEFLAQRNAAPRAGYGARFFLVSEDIPREMRVQFTQPGTPAAEVVSGQANLVRGSRILEIDGVDLVNANTQGEIDILNNGLFPASAGEQHTFVVEDPGSALRRTVIMTSANVTIDAVNSVQTIDTATGKVGYLLVSTFSPFSSEEELADAFAFLKAEGVVDLVLDLRYNNGGLLAVASQLAYMVAGDARTAGKAFERLQFNDAAGDRNPATGEPNEPLPFFTTGVGFSLPSGTPLESLDLSRVYVLSTAETCSASESVINGLRGVGVEVILVGDATCGKPFGFFPRDNCGETYFTIQFRGANDQGFGDYADGFTPQNARFQFGVRTLGDANEAVLDAALDYRASGVCPVTPLVSSSPISASAVRIAGETLALRAPAGDVFRNNRDMTMPD